MGAEFQDWKVKLRSRFQSTISQTNARTILVVGAKQSLPLCSPIASEPSNLPNTGQTVGPSIVRRAGKTEFWVCGQAKSKQDFVRLLLGSYNFTTSRCERESIQHPLHNHLVRTPSVLKRGIEAFAKPLCRIRQDKCTARFVEVADASVHSDFQYILNDPHDERI